MFSSDFKTCFSTLHVQLGTRGAKAGSPAAFLLGGQAALPLPPDRVLQGARRVPPARAALTRGYPSALPASQGAPWSSARSRTGWERQSSF